MVGAATAAGTAVAVRGAVAHLGGVIAAGTRTNPAVTVHTARTALTYLEEGRVGWRAVMHVNRLIGGACGVCRDPCCIADLTAVTVSIGGA